MTMPNLPRDDKGQVELYAWPGGYPIGYITDDGELLCGRCVNDPTNPIHYDEPDDGWRIMGAVALEGGLEDYGGPVHCVHCNQQLVGELD